MDSCAGCETPMVEGARELRLSWSQLRYFDECHQKAYLIRNGKKSKDTNIRVFWPGTVVDRCMRDYLNDDNRTSGQMVRSLQAVMEREEKLALESGDGVVKYKSRADKMEVLEFCTELLKRLEPLLSELILPHDFEPSKRFKVPVVIPYIDGKPTTILLVGEMDILMKYKVPNKANKPWEVWDLKATKNDQYWRSTIGQLVFYDLCTFLMYREYTLQAGLIQPMCKQQTIAIQITDQQRVEMMQRIIAMAHSVWKSEVYAGTPVGEAEIEVRPDTKHCYMCSVKSSCYRFQPIGSKMNLGIGSLDDIELFVPSEKDLILAELFEI